MSKLSAKMIANFPGYLIYPDGRLFSSNYRKGHGQKYLKPRSVGAGYLVYSLHSGGRFRRVYVHRLVAEHFLPPQPSSKHQINHIDGDKHNNHCNNLEWVTPSENQKRRITQGTYHQRSGIAKATLTPMEVIKIKKLLTKGELSHSNIARQFNVGREAITKIANNKRWAWLTEDIWSIYESRGE